MFETAVDVLRQPLAVFGVSGVLIGFGVILFDRRRYFSDASILEQRSLEEDSGSEDER